MNNTFKEWGGIVHIELKEERLTSLCKEVESLQQSVVKAKAILARKDTECELLVANAGKSAFAKLQSVASKAKKDEHCRLKELEETVQLLFI